MVLRGSAAIVLMLAQMLTRCGRIRLLASRRSRSTKVIRMMAIPAASMTPTTIQITVWWPPECRRVEVAGGEADGDEEQQDLGGPARGGRDGAGADRRRRVVAVALEEPDPEREHRNVPPDQRGEGVRRLERKAPAVGQLARDGAVQRPRLRDDRKLGEHESQRHPSPVEPGALR